MFDKTGRKSIALPRLDILEGKSIHLQIKSTNFGLCCKQASGRLRLPSKLKCFLDSQPASELHRSLILPVATFCGHVNLKLSTSQLKALAALHECVMNITGMNSKECSILPTEKCNLKRACILVCPLVTIYSMS